MQALVLCHLDYCNSLLYNLPDSQLGKLQIVQNSAARLITGQKKSSHITPTLEQLHWLPVHYRILFKILLFTFQCIHDMGPVYLKELLVRYEPRRSLRSSKNDILSQPTVNTKSYGERSFFFAAPTQWNILPEHIKEATSVPHFKKLLKTHLFEKYFHE